MSGAGGVASDIGRRLAELRERLGENQRDFAARFGRGWKQVSMWERGHQRPRPGVLALATQKNGWPDGIFEEGGPRPSEIPLEQLKRPVEARSGDPAAPRSGLGRRKEDVELRRAANDAARLARLVSLMETYVELRRPVSPEVLIEWLEIVAANAAPSSPALPAPRLAPPDSGARSGPSGGSSPPRSPP